MPSPRLALVALTLLGAVAISSATPLLPRMHLHPATAPGTAHLMVFGGRSAAQLAGTDRKLDAALADLVTHAHLARPEHALEDLHSLSPAARFGQGPDGSALVTVDALTRGDPQRLKDTLVALGLQHAAVYGNDVGGLLPVSEISAAAGNEELLSLRAAMWRTRAGPVTSQGDFAQGSAALRSANSALTGAGVTVGVISDSFNCYAYYAANPTSYTQFGINSYYPQPPNGIANPPDATQDEASGALPASVNVVQEADCANFGGPLQLPDSDEGRAMLQIVHDVAPGASLAFYGLVAGEADFANGVAALASAGARVEADDIGFFDEPFFQDSIISQAIDSVVTRTTNPVAYFVAAGNNGGGMLSYENTAPSFNTPSTSSPNAGEMLVNFDTSGATTTVSLPITIASFIPGELAALVVEWDQPYATSHSVGGGPGATSQIDLCVTSASGSDQILNLNGNPATCTGPNTVGTDPVQVLILANPANSGANTPSETLTLQIGLVNGSGAPGRIKFVLEDDGAGSSISNQFNTSSPTIQGHANDAHAGTVGAAFYAQTPRCGITPALLETFSSAGGDPVLFDDSGNAQTPVVRQKPDFVGPDGVNNTFLGQIGSLTSNIAQCDVNANFPTFFGTSAATPHIAAVAALLMQYNSALTPAQIYTALRNTASPMGAVPNLNSGYGFIQADQAIAQVPAGATPPSSGGHGGGGGVDGATLLALASLLCLQLLRATRTSRRVQRAVTRI
jgi:Subtilase family